MNINRKETFYLSLHNIFFSKYTANSNNIMFPINSLFFLIIERRSFKTGQWCLESACPPWNTYFCPSHMTFYVTVCIISLLNNFNLIFLFFFWQFPSKWQIMCVQDCRWQTCVVSSMSLFEDFFSVSQISDNSLSY